MTVAFDTTFLSLVFNPQASPCVDPDTGQPVSYFKEKLAALLDELRSKRSIVLIPTPCLAELLVRAPDIRKIRREINASPTFQFADFDARTAIDYAETMKKLKAHGDKRGGSKKDWQQVKFDRQIVAIAKTHGATSLYTNDHKQAAFSEQYGLQVVRSWELTLPPQYAQTSLFTDSGAGTTRTPAVDASPDVSLAIAPATVSVKAEDSTAAPAPAPAPGTSE